jgi:hypothetical protein
MYDTIKANKSKNMNKSKLKLPNQIAVSIQKGESEALVAVLEKYDAVTEGNSLTELFFNVNDLIYTIFDVPKKLQEDIQFIPSKEAQIAMVSIAQSQPKKFARQFEINRFIKDDSYQRIAMV